LSEIITTLVARQTKVSHYEYEFNKSEFPSEVYFYRIKSRNLSTSKYNGQAGKGIVETKYMILI